MTICQDTKVPVITCPAGKTTGTDLGHPNALVSWEKPEAVDNSGHDPSVTCTPTSGTKFAIGTTSVECVAIDEAGNRNSCEFSIEVKGKMFYSQFVYFSVLRA